MNVFTTPGKILVTCNRGLAPCLQRELAELGYETLESLNTGVITHGTLEDCIRLNLHLRCASQVMYSLRAFECADPEQLYDILLSMRWEELLDSDGYFTVHGNVVHPSIQSGMFANVKVKDAIVDRMRRETGRRPDTGSELRGAVVYLFWRGDHAEIFFDTSGETLAKHGYRKRPGRAPMVEALAAGTLLASRWDRKVPLVNPMCGSGTIAIEAALMASRRYPGLLRSSYAFMRIKDYDPKFFRAELKKVKEAVISVPEVKILASDIDSESVQIARTNAQAAGVADMIEFSVCDFADTTIPEEGGVIIFNPEYGERLGEESELEGTYRRIGDFMKQKCGGYWGYIFTGNMLLAKKVGLKSKRRIEFATAQLDCRLLEFELYMGTRRPPAEADNQSADGSASVEGAELVTRTDGVDNAESAASGPQSADVIAGNKENAGSPLNAASQEIAGSSVNAASPVNADSKVSPDGTKGIDHAKSVNGISGADGIDGASKAPPLSSAD